uniref:Lipoprotein n=1 Tax=uncultured Alphaproteobacteria bacterium TaxID=91750 RepID=A0A6G8F2P8_9PROT|nr:hypothetical protein PlAlph_0950 [uncultured Alphaproteobacteria bacterium]
MKNNLIFMMLAAVSLSFTSCDMSDNSADVKIIASGYFKKDGEFCFVEIDSVKYARYFVYPNKSGRDGKQKMVPVDGRSVTVFLLSDSPAVELVAGEQSEECLEESFSTKSCSPAVEFVASEQSKESLEESSSTKSYLIVFVVFIIIIIILDVLI